MMDHALVEGTQLMLLYYVGHFSCVCGTSYIVICEIEPPLPSSNLSFPHKIAPSVESSQKVLKLTSH